MQTFATLGYLAHGIGLGFAAVLPLGPMKILCLRRVVAYGALAGCVTAAGVVSGEDTLVSGPAETAGEAQDRAAESANAAIEANADAAEDRADAIRSTADREADALEERAKKVRRDAEQKAGAAEDRADAIRGK